MPDKPAILVVEDEPSLRHAYQIVLDAHHYTALTASDGKAGLAALRRHKPQIVLLDMLMPKLDGLGFMRQAEVAANFPNTKIIAFSNLSNTQQLDEMYQLGIYRHVLKADVNPAQLVQIIESALADSGRDTTQKINTDGQPA